MINNRVFSIILILCTLLVSAQPLQVPDSTYINKNIKSINVNTSYKNGNWNPVLKQVKNKRIVLLGEPNHGSKEIFESRNDLIKALHEKLDFNVILFESGLGELISINLQKETLNPTEMTYGFFSGWRTSEFVDLMEYIKANDISISGFDVQRTGNSFENLMKTELKRLGLDANQLSRLEARFSEEKKKLTNRKSIFDSLNNSTNTLIKDYKQQLSSIELLDNQYLDHTSHLVIRTIKNRIKYLEYFLVFVKDKDWSKRWQARDSMMYSNMDWLLKTIYKNQKVIVIAHNFHISKHNGKEEVMGEFLKKKYGSKMYAIGVFAGKGSFFNNRGQEEQLKPVSDIGLDIKHVIHRLSSRVGFLNIPKKANKNTNWLFNDIIINDTFIDLNGSNQMILSENFDGLIFIDEISPPKKI
ncbi:erythromycin esterase family protein [uncultured Psychroserpens sp.]|uniref:erythromycin esterase family protein n=1 Tax=uncultured Psychroserpens sp. TaxID=255436 RepID=UPI00260CB610|nr:erythromycin esterase family protein [uncultured Psychroserpens sp.]